MKDTFWYRSGDLWLPPFLVEFLDSYIVGSDSSIFYLNYWHVNHFFSGVFFALFHLYVYHFAYPIHTYLILHTLWEIWQLFLGMTPTSLRGLVDIWNDTLLGTLGAYITLRLERK
jgi:hypothetical protein